ncbi:MAG: RluA family pseudouridine synthase [Akkermansiaceae bacterium]
MTSLPILFRDEWLVAIDKPPGVMVHPSDHPQATDLVAMKILRDQIDEKIHVIHRLDQPTSGVLIFATDRGAARKIRQDFENRLIGKRYLAMVHGHPSEEMWTCVAPLRKTPEAPEKSAETSFRVLQRNAQELALVEATPQSGRFHQIRRHLVSTGHPIVGDFRYQDPGFCKSIGDSLGIGTRMLLQAKAMEFQHPVTKKRTVIEAPMDKHIARLSKI